MDVTGESRQEEKIKDMSAVVEDVHKGIATLTVKGVFRFAITEALKEHGHTSWKVVGTQPAHERERFFQTVCERAIPRLVKLGLPRDKESTLRNRLQELNRKYVGK